MTKLGATPTDLALEAAQWAVELQSDEATDDTHQRWLAWREAHADHELAWQRLARFQARLANVPSPLARAALMPATSSRRRQIVKLIVAGVTGTSAWSLQDRVPWRAWRADRSTDVGVQAHHELPDGTSLWLNTLTAVDIAYSPRERVVILLRGELLITTAPDASPPSAGTPRPFVVQTRQGQVRPLGTRFTVRDVGGHPDSTTDVAVFAGAVRLQPADVAAATTTLHQGQTGQLSRHAARMTGAASEDTLAWTRGMLVAIDMPLGRLLAELSRYRAGHLGCDPAVAGLSVSGTFPLADTDRVLDMLSTTLPVRIERIGRYWARVAPAVDMTR